jgi:lipopolysaccharide transport system ATP-binding protein
MPSSPIISVRGLGKKYILGETLRHDTFRDHLAGMARGLFHRGAAGGAGPKEEEFWALKDVSFDVQEGEVLGIIGRNGAGKSTLLKVLSRITEPTTGEVRMRGRVASLLEVGTGFHPELTGRENVFLNGAILGMRQAEIKAKFDEIVAFSGVERFLDTPVKRYSSGMYVRLAFAVAAHLEPEILIVDEVLAVGDAEFQKKCLGKMQDVAGQGRTVLFVSHNMIAVQSLCTRALLFDSGLVVRDSDVNSTIDRYLRRDGSATGEVRWATPDLAPGNEELRLNAVRVVSNGETTATPAVDQDIEIQIDYWNLTHGGRRLVSIWVLDALAQPLFTSANSKSASATYDPWVDRGYDQGLYRTTCVIPRFLLNPGQHRINLYVNHRGVSDNILFLADVIGFEVSDASRFRTEYLGKWIGAVRPLLAWRTEMLTSTACSS